MIVTFDAVLNYITSLRYGGFQRRRASFPDLLVGGIEDS